MYLIYINPLNKDFKGQNTYEFIFAKRIDNIEYGEDWDVQPASSGTPTPPNVEQIDSVGVLKTDEIETDVRIIFQSISNLHKACPNHPGDWYFTGDYPTPGGMRVVNRAFMNFYEGKKERAY